MAIADVDRDERTDDELTCPVPSCTYTHRSAQGIAAHVGSGHANGWDDADASPADVHVEATVRDEDAFRAAAKVRAYLAREGVTTDAVRVFWHGGYGNVQILVTASLGDQWDAFRQATDVDGIQYVGDGRSYCTEAFVDGLPEAPVRETAQNAAACAVIGCTNDEGLRPVEHPDRGTRVLCRYHRKHYLGVSS